MTSNIFINESLHFLDEFKGTYSCDDLPQIINSKLTKYFVVNLDLSTGVGTHFIFLELGSKHALYWDPLGNNLSNIHIKNYLKKMRLKSIKCVTSPIQDSNSIPCGLFCIALVLARSKMFSVRKIISFFSEDLMKNENNLLKLIKYIQSLK